MNDIKKSWTIYAIAIWSLWSVWSVGVVLGNYLVEYFDGAMGYSLVLMLAVTIATSLLVYRLFTCSSMAYRLYGYYSALVSIICIAVALAALIYGLQSKTHMSDNVLPHSSMGLAIFLAIGAIIYLIPSALTAYVCLVKKPYL